MYGLAVSTRPLPFLVVAAGLVLSPAAALAADGGAEPPGVGVEVALFDDGLRVPEDPARALPPSPFPGKSVELFALRGETVAFQVVLAGSSEAPVPAHAVLSPFTGSSLEATPFVEHFLRIERTSGNDHRPDDSLAFTPSAKPRPAMLGAFADPLVPGSDVVLQRGRRAALWVDVHVPESATPGLAESKLQVVSARGVEAEVVVRVAVGAHEMPFAAQPVMIYYEPEALRRRMGGLRAEPSLRRLLHAHHAAGIRPVLDEKALEAEAPYLTGEAFTKGAGYTGPGEARGEGIVVLGSYGDLGEPKRDKVPLVERLHGRVKALDPRLETFLYAVDEECKSPWPAEWKRLLAESAAKELAVGATCGTDPLAHAADVVIQLPEDLDPSRVAPARERAKAVWAYNGRRPYSGAPVVDVPSTDLVANGWIAARYGIPRWFYWEATSWTSYGGGKVGGDTDPFVVAESFKNRDGDHSNGDGILVYPATQIVPGMRSFGEDTVYPSVRLKAIRRGIQDVGYVRLARASFPREADAIVARLVPRALREADGAAGPSWPDEPRPFHDARRELFELVGRSSDGVVPAPLARAPSAVPVRPGEASRSARFAAVLGLAALVFALGLVPARPRRSK